MMTNECTEKLAAYLLHVGDVARDRAHGDGILERQLVRLALDAGVVHEYAGVGTQSGEGEHDVLVDAVNLADGPVVLQRGDRLLLHADHNAVLSAHSDLNKGMNERNRMRDSVLTAVDPFLTASCAYSTWNKWPSGLKIVIARS